MGLDGFSLYPLVTDLNNKLAGGRIDRVFQPNKHTILLTIRQPGRNFTLHISINPQSGGIYCIDRTMENPAVPPVFCMVLRKQLEDGRIAMITQTGLDRIVTIHVDTLGIGGIIVTKVLIIELMGKYSNIILTKDELIIDAMRKVGGNENRMRQILPGREYITPPNQDKVNLLTTTADQWTTELKKYPDIAINKAIIRASLGIGPVSANEFVWRAGLPPSISTDKMDVADFQALYNAVAEIVADYKNNIVSPVAVLDENRKLLAVSAFTLHYLAGNCHAFTAIGELLDFSSAIAGSYTPPDKEKYKKLIANEISKAENKYTRLTEELEQAHNAVDYKIKGDILMTYQYQLTDRYLKEVYLPDIYNDQPETNKIKIALDPLLSPQQNMQKYYQKYNKLKRAQESLLGQLKNCQADIRYLGSIENSLVKSTTLLEINEIKSELVASGYIKETTKKKPQVKPSEPLKLALDGLTILVGRNNYQNDRLTFKIADPFDIWLHVKDIPGSHVIIRCGKQTPADELLQQVAEIAAYFSKADSSSNVPVDYTQRRYVKKPAGAKPGFVIYTEQKTLYVTPDKGKIEKLLL